MRVLISEDDTLLADGLRRVLETAMFAVDVVQTGEDADKLLRTGAYDLVVLDVGLPGIDGFEVLRRLRAGETLSAY
jgi:DNA-binding response OmpR family regulator